MSALTQQPNLFEESILCPIDYYPDFFRTHCQGKADEMFEYSKSLKWQQNRIRGTHLPRQETLYGDPGISYSYSGIMIRSNGWDTWIKRLTEVISEFTGYDFNFAIGNRYRNASDSIGWHDDGRRELGEMPAIASISLGETRRFQIRQKPLGDITTIHLTHGSLLVMHPGCQENWLHQVPKETTPRGERINWTFRLSKK